MVIAAIVVALLVGAYFLFKDSLNLFQAPFGGKLRIYWVTRDIEPYSAPLIRRNWAMQDLSLHPDYEGSVDYMEKPVLYGEGIQIRIHPRRTFQFGILLSKKRMWRRLGPELNQVRTWQRPELEDTTGDE